MEQKLFDNKLALSATYFSLNTENLIQFDLGTFTYANTNGITRRNGLELSANAQLTDWFRASLAYTHTNTKDANGDRLAKVPAQFWTLGADIQPMDKLSLNITANIVHDTLEGGTPLDDYVLLNGKLNYEFNDSFSAYVRGVNLLNQEYQTSRGYGTSDRAVYAGVKIKFHAE